MKKSLFKLIVICIGAIYLSQPGTMDNIKSKTREMVNKPFIQIQHDLNRLMNFWGKIRHFILNDGKIKTVQTTTLALSKVFC